MKIIIAGCGKVGESIAEQLSREGHDVAIIDVSSDVISSITNKCDVIGVVGNSASYSVQKEAGVEDADLLIAVTDSDEVNMLCCLIARKAGNCRTIARVRNPIYSEEVSFIKDELGLSMAINPEQQTAKEISRILRSPSAINIDTFARGRIEMTEFILPEGNTIDGMTVMDVRKKIQSDLLICAVERDDDVCIPHGSFVLKANDVVYFIASPEDGKAFFRAIGIEQQKIKNVMIVGGSAIAYYLTRILLPMGMNVKLIEKDRRKCLELCELIPGATVINGDATDQELLEEEGIRDVDAFISLSGLDEANILLSLTAMNFNKKVKVVTKTSKQMYESVIGKLDIGSLVHPKLATANSIVRYVRALQNGMGTNVETMYRIVNNRAEALEFIINQESEVLGTAIADLPIIDNVLIAAISRGRDIMYPNGQTRLMVGDRVVIVTTKNGITDIKDILKK